MSGQNELITRFARELAYYLKVNPNVDLENVDHTTPEMDFDLGTAHNNKKIHDRSGDKIFITALTGVAYIQTRLRGAKYKLRPGKISLPFKELFLTNTAQAGKTLSLVVGYGAFVDFIASNRDLLTAISGKDFATQTSLALLKTKVDTIFTEVQKLSTCVSNHDTSTGAALTVSLDVGMRSFVEVYMKTSAAATFKLYGSRNNVDWRPCDEIEFDGAGELKNGYWNADRYIKVSTTDANDNEIEITAS